MCEPMTFQKKSRRERYIVRDDVAGAEGLEPSARGFGVDVDRRKPA